jgi:hypothetical protein
MDLFVNNKKDIEANLASNLDDVTVPNDIVTHKNFKDNKKTTNALNDSYDDRSGIYCLKFTIIFLILLLELPLTVCDLYYAYNDDSCVSSPVDRISVNLKEYLIVSGLLLVCFQFIIISIVILYNENSKGFLLAFGTILFVFISIFNTTWNIIGGVIFWSYMDNSICSNNVFNYVFASLIIKYVFAAFSIFSNNKEK